MKRFLSISLLVVMLVAIVGCASPAATAQPAAGATAAPKKLKFGFTAMNATGDSNQGMHYQTLQEYGTSKGIEMVMLDPKGDPNTQISQIENLIQLKVDVIIIRATNATAIIPAMKKAHDAGIPVIVTTNIIDMSGFNYMTAFVGPSDLLQSSMAAQVFIDFYKDSPKTTVNVLEVQHLMGSTVGILRTRGFAEKIAGTKVKVLEAQPAEGNAEKAQQITEAWLLKYKPGEIDGIYVEGTGMGFGVTNAIKAANRIGEFPVVFIATSKASFDLIKSGELYASVDQNPIDEAKLTIDTALRILAGEKVELLTYTPSTVTTKTSIDSGKSVRPIW
jgi:ribose transport system substrate-binding protein